MFSRASLRSPGGRKAVGHRCRQFGGQGRIQPIPRARDRSPGPLKRGGPGLLKGTLEGAPHVLHGAEVGRRRRRRRLGHRARWTPSARGLPWRRCDLDFGSLPRMSAPLGRGPGKARVPKARRGPSALCWCSRGGRPLGGSSSHGVRLRCRAAVRRSQPIARAHCL